MTLEQRIAIHARALVLDERDPPGDPEHKSESAFRAFAEGFPSLLLQCGLLQTAAFLDAGRQREHERMRDHVRKHFQDLGLLPDAETLAGKVGNLDAAGYRKWMELAVRIAVWEKRLAQAVLRRGARPS